MYRKTLIVIAFITCFATFGDGISFRKVVEIADYAMNRAVGFDTDQDGRQNLVFGSYNVLFYNLFWEHIGFDRYFLEDSAPGELLCDIGFLDADSLVDMICNRRGAPNPMQVFESPTINSHPTNIVWQDSGFSMINFASITDLDQDGIKEFLFSYSWAHVCIYENTGDNQYSLVWIDTLNNAAEFVDGDFDLDGQIEFITGFPYDGGGWVHVWECTGDDSYQLVFRDTITIGDNNYDIFKASDMDGNGKPEILFTSIYFFSGTAHLFCYETIGDNNYEYFLIDSVTGLPGNAVTSLSSCGDIDADGVEEIVWSSLNQWHIYKAIGIQQYQRIYSSTWTLHDQTDISIYDLNENGYPEVIESWFQGGIPEQYGVIIWEIEGVRLHQPNGGETLQVGSQYPITWEKFDPPGADSFSLFVSFNNGIDYNPIITIPQPNDTMYLWTVPDSVSDSCKIMIWAYGPPRSGEQEPRGTAWDFSDSVFVIVPQGVEEHDGKVLSEFSLKILQNPVLNKNLTIHYVIPRKINIRLIVYNILGQVERILVSQESNAGIYEININDLQSGIYFVQLQTKDFRETKKVILLR